MRNAQWRALGISEADCEKPKIAVVNSSSELASCYSHLDEVAKVVKAAIRAAGGLPFEIRTAAPRDFITGAGARGAYMLAARDLVTNDIEVAVEGAQLDGMVCLTTCDKTVPGQLMAAARLNIPTLVVPCGYQASGMHRGHHCDIEDVFVGAMHVVTGAMDVETLVGMSRQAIRSPGVCSGMGTANSMHIVCEALGMALPGSAPVAAMSSKMMADVRAAGARIVSMVRDDLKPRDILRPGAFPASSRRASPSARRGASPARRAVSRPAMGGGASRVVFALDGAGLGDQVAMLTDGHLSGLVCKGLVVAELSPEAALGGPIALVQEGDSVTIDLDARRCDLEITPDEMDRRRQAWVAPRPLFDRGWLQIYRANVGPLPQGAVLTRNNT